MLPANQLAGFGDLSFNSHSHSIYYFNSAQTPISYPNPTKFQLELRDRSGEEDEWAVYTSSRVAPREIGTGDLQAGPTQKPDESADDWGLFVTSPLGGNANRTIFPGITSGKLDNGGSQVGPAQNGEDWGLFISSPGASQPKANGSNPVSSDINSILTQTNNGSTELASTCQESDQKDRIDNIQANRSQERMILEEEEEEWGNFVSTPVASPANNSDTNGTRPSIFNEISQGKLGSVNLHVRPIDYEEEWGEFVSSPVASGPKNSTCNSSSASPSLKWQKPKGPIPLSFFGGEEELEREEIKLEALPNLGPVSVSHSDSFSDASPSISSQVVKEIILNHHGGNENSELRNGPYLKINGNDFDQETTTTNGSKNSTSNLGSTGGKAEYSATSWDHFANGENGVVIEAWEFKDASSDITGSLTASPLKEDSTNSWASFPLLNGQAVCSSAVKLKDDTLSLHTEPDHSEKKGSSLGLLSNTKMAADETDQSCSSESTIYSVLKFYRKLQEGSLLLISHHIKGHKEASKVISFVGQNFDDERLDKEIQEAYRELKNLNVSEVLNLENGSRDACINELLTSTEELFLKTIEREYQLSTKILLAVENLGAALDLLKHSLSTVNVLEMASMEGISVYISTWYSLISVCSQELKNGASIWAQSSSANLSDKLISSGENYFIALGEIYRVVEILKLSLKSFSLLLLLSNQNRLNELGVCLDICTKAWSSGLDVALEIISNGNSARALNAKSLTESIKRIREVDIQNDKFYNEKTVCKLCLLPLALLPEMKSVTWHGDQYVMKLVNLWANKISPEAPKVPSIQMK